MAHQAIVLKAEPADCTPVLVILAPGVWPHQSRAKSLRGATSTHFRNESGGRNREQKGTQDPVRFHRSTYLAGNLVDPIPQVAALVPGRCLRLHLAVRVGGTNS